MNKEKEIKKQIIEKAAKSPETFFPIDALQSFNLQRQQCQTCGTYFWSLNSSPHCGEPDCSGGYSFIEKTPAQQALSFPDVYLEFSKMLKKQGYTPIKRFPVVARWRDDLDFNIASIIGFQPFVVKGEVEPPANPLTIPQICLRFGDIDNIGYTGRHHTGFTMIGQHAFTKPKEYNINEYFKVLMNWYLEGMKIPLEELKVHEDAWTGGGCCGASLEIFAGGLELGNQVYMTYDMSYANNISELVDLDLKVLDMGMGQERCCWFSNGSLNSFEACMPKVCNYLFEKTQLQPNWELYKQFLPYSGTLNIDEVDNIDTAWEELANKLQVDTATLKQEIEPLAGIYSIADHTRTLLYAISDGALPSNVKGGYNLRLILRRALDFIEKFNWDIDLYEVMKVHAEELYSLYPELKEELESHTGDRIPTIKKLIDLEVQRYHKHREKINHIVKKIANQGKILTNDDFVKYYISEGITPEDIKQGYKQIGTEIKTPANFYTLLTQYFDQQQQKEQREDKTNQQFHKEIENLPPTHLLYYQDSYQQNGDATIIKEFSINTNNYIILDKTLFYPTGGGQMCDIGYIGDKKVIDVFKIGSIVIHKVE